MEDRANGAIFTLVIGIAGTVYFLYLAFMPWFRPNEWRKREINYRKRIKKNWSFMPEAVVHSFLEKHPKLDLWYARIGYLFGSILFLTFTLWFYIKLPDLLNP